MKFAIYFDTELSENWSWLCVTDGEQCTCSWHRVDARNWDDCGTVWDAQRQGLHIL